MKYPKSKTISRKKVLIAITALALILSVGGIFALSQNNNSNSPENDTTTSESTSGNTIPLSDEEIAMQIKERGSSATPSQTEEKVIISEAFQDPSSKQIVIKTELHGQGWTRCELTITQGMSMLSKMADVLYQSSFWSCLGFAIPVEEFPTGGVWSVTLKGVRTDNSFQLSTNTQVNVVK